jgi:hypothetical protein
MYPDPYEPPSELFRVSSPVSRQKALEREQQQIGEAQRRERAEAATRSARTVGNWVVAFIIAVLAGIVCAKLFGG